MIGFIRKCVGQAVPDFQVPSPHDAGANTIIESLWGEGQDEG